MGSSNLRAAITGFFVVVFEKVGEGLFSVTMLANYMHSFLLIHSSRNNAMQGYEGHSFKN